MNIDDLVSDFRERRFDAVIERGGELLLQDPDNAALLLIRAQACLELGRAQLAIPDLQRLLRLDVYTDQASHLLGRALRDSGDTVQARQAFLQVQSASPLYVDSQLQVAGFYQLEGDFEKTCEVLQELRQAFPRESQPVHALASVKALEGLLEEAISLAEAAYALNSSSIQSLFLAADCTRLLGEQPRCQKFIQKILSRAPNHPVAHLFDLTNCIPPIYQSQVEIEKARARYTRKLGRLKSALSSQVASRNLCGPFSQAMYNLPYQGRNDRRLQKQYGDIAVRLHHEAYPQWSSLLPMPPVQKRIRVGFLSAFFNLHSNWRIPIKGWVSQLNHEEFEVFGYSVSNKCDAASQEAEALIEHFVVIPAGFERMAEQILADRLHVLIIPEIGMSADVSRLAMLRLAPVQCGSWGHPNTSGLSTMDYFLSSDLMEPEEGQDAYTEKLVRLPNSSVYIDSDFPPADNLTREEFGLRDSATVFLCIQFLSKYLPQYDDLLVKIAARVPDSQFVFLMGKKPPIYEQLSQRMRQAFEKNNMDYEHHVCWLPFMPGDRFRALQRVADVFLDTTEWSGCNTAVEAIHNDLPIVTLPGRWMRGRHCYAFLKQIGVEKTIATSAEEYVSLAVRLGTDAEFRRRISRQIAESKHRLFCDQSTIDGLSDFLRRVVQQSS